MGRKKIKPEIVTKNVDKLCEMVNEKYNLISNSIGSIEHHHDASENSILFSVPCIALQKYCNFFLESN